MQQQIKDIKKMSTIQKYGLIKSHIRSIETLINNTENLNPSDKREMKNHLINLEYAFTCGYKRIN